MHHRRGRRPVRRELALRLLLAMERENIAGNSPYEELVGFSRAVRVGNVVYVSGTVATTSDGSVAGAGDAYAQAKQALANVEAALAAAGASLADVVRTRMYLVDVADWEAVARAHREAFGAVRPASTMLEAGRLLDPAMLVEIEAEAVVG